MTLEQRLERLERENRWMRRIGVMAAAVAAAVFLVGQGKDKEPQDLVVRSLKVKDNAGRERIAIGLDAVKASSIRLSDETGETTMTLRARLGVLPTLNLAHKKSHIELGNGGGLPTLEFVDWEGRERVMLVVSPRGPILWFIDEEKHVRVVLGTQHDGSIDLAFADGKGDVWTTQKVLDETQAKRNTAKKQCRAFWETAQKALKHTDVPILKPVVDPKNGKRKLVKAKEEQQKFYDDHPLGVDPWGNRYSYRLISTSREALTFKTMLHVCSNGPDGKPETEDDITYPALKD